MTGGKLITRLIAPVLAITVLLVGWQLSSRGEPLETTVSEEVLAADTLMPADLPANVSFVRVPAVWNPLLQLHARAFYTAEALGKDEEMHPTFFREIHVNGNYLDSEQSLQAFFEQFDVSPEDFSNAFNSFAVHTKLQRADDLSRRYRIASVPTVIVNGKYTTDASMAGNYDTLMDLVDELVALEAAGN